MKLTDELRKFLTEQGYSGLTETKHYGIIGIRQFIFTFGLCVGLDRIGLDRRYCYTSLGFAQGGLIGLIMQDQLDLPPVDPDDEYWIKCKGRREYTNPRNSQIVQE